MSHPVRDLREGDRLNELSKQIRSPAPFWFLNGPIERQHVVREFEMMSAKGIEDVVLHPRYGLQVRYLSDDWFQLFGWCVDEAKKHGMHIWIYDELNWPSGTAGMSVMQMDPNHRSKYLSVRSAPLSQIDFDTFEPGLYLIAGNIEGGQVTKTRQIDNVDALRALTGDWRIFNCSLRHDRFYIDTMSPEAVRAFRRVTYDEYYKRFGAEFGKTIRAIFTDEPSIYWVSVGYDDCNLPWTQDYFSTFEQRYGYAPAPMIPYLFYPGREAARFRADYWQHAGRLFNERYHGTLSAWCRDHGIIYTGHDHHEEPLRYQIRFAGDMFGAMRTMDVPGVDHLGKHTLGNNWISVIGHKICSSEAHTSGKARCMSESFGLMDWDTTYTHLKRVTDWQYALGINMLVPHAIFHTISGMTKRECPPSFFYQSPHWEDFDYFTQYVRRLEEMLCGGRHRCRVAVLYPLTGLLASYQTDEKTAEFEFTDNFLNSLCLELIRNHIDWDFVDFAALKQAELAEGKIKLADEAYEFLIVPVTSYMRREEVARLTEAAAHGVRTTFFHKSMEPIEQNMPEGLRGAAFVRTEELQGYIDSLRRELDDDLQIAGGGADDIMVYRREKDGRKITFLLNRSEKHRKVTATLRDHSDPAVYDQETGTWTRLVGRRIGRKTQLQLRFRPNQSYFVVSSAPEAKEPAPLEREPAPVALTDLRASLPFNVASIYRFSYAREGQEPVEMDVRTSPAYISCNWDPSPPDFREYAGVYESEVEIDAVTDGIKMIVDRDFAQCQVYVNGERVRLRPCSEVQTSTLDHQPLFLTDVFDLFADVGDLLKRGKNHLKVVSPTKLSEPLRLVGSFRVRVEGPMVRLIEPGEADPLHPELDYPFYSGTVTYTARFDLDLQFASLVLNLHDVRDAAEVWVNGRFAGKRLWAPYMLDIASLARPGPNLLQVKVRNNMTNLLMGNPRPLGLRDMPTLAGA